MSTPRSSPHYDVSAWEAIIDLDDGRPDLLTTLLSRLLATYPEQLAQLKRAFASADLNAIHFAAHALKNTFQALAFQDVSRLSREIELEAYAGRLEGASRMMADLESHCDLALAAVREYLDENPLTKSA